LQKINLKDKHIYLIANLFNQIESNFLEIVENLLNSGIKLFQFRAKNKKIDKIKYFSEKLKLLSDKYNSIFIINDYIELVDKFNIDGVHLGHEDMPLGEAKEQFKHKILGYTVNYKKDLDLAKKHKVDYIGIGPAYYTKTKSKKRLTSLLGPSGIKKLLNQTNLHYYAIGGINKNNILKLKRYNINYFAISSFLMLAKNPSRRYKELLDLIK